MLKKFIAIGALALTAAAPVAADTLDDVIDAGVLPEHRTVRDVENQSDQPGSSNTEDPWNRQTPVQGHHSHPLRAHWACPVRER